MHDITLRRPATTELDTAPSTLPKITQHFSSDKGEQLPAVLASLAAVDGISFITIASSNEIRKCLRTRQFKVPKSANTIKKYIMQYYDKIREQVVQEISAMKKQYKFSISFDEWTSIANKRYISIIIYGYHKNWNLGLVRIRNEANAENCIKMVDRRLLEYQLSLSEDIVSVTTDGASTMVKLGRLISPSHQLCFAHGIQLGIVDILYKKKIYAKSEDQDVADSDTDNNFDTDDNSDDDSEDNIGIDAEAELFDITTELYNRKSEKYCSCVPKISKKGRNPSKLRQSRYRERGDIAIGLQDKMEQLIEND